MLLFMGMNSKTLANVTFEWLDVAPFHVNLCPEKYLVCEADINLTTIQVNHLKVTLTWTLKALI